MRRSATIALAAGALVAGVVVAPPAQAGVGTTYRVFENAVCGPGPITLPYQPGTSPLGTLQPGTFQWALDQANTHPGPDIIEFDASLVWVDLAPCWQPNMPFPYSVINATESVLIKGNGVRMEGNQAFVDASGNVNNTGLCPSSPGAAGSHWIEYSTGFLQVGTYGADNSGIEVWVENMEFHNINSLFKVEKYAYLSVADARAWDIDAFMEDCDRPVIETAYEGADVTLSRVQIDHSHAPGARTGVNDIAAIVQGGNGGHLELDEVFFGENVRGRAVTWLGTSVRIVSSQFVNSGGMYLGTDDTQVVNSILYTRGTKASDRVFTNKGALHVEASTFYWANPTCDPPLSPDDPMNPPPCETAGGTTLGMGFLAEDGTVDFKTTAVGASDISGPGAELLVGTPGAFSSDSLTWVQPTAYMVGPFAVPALLPNALFDPPGLTTSAWPWLGYESIVTPLLGTSGTPGVLIDAVPDATCAPGRANALYSPIDTTCIATDALGVTYRVDGNGTRNIGAVQLTLAPHLSVAGVGDGHVDLAWSRPEDPGSGAITGYKVFYVPTAGGTTVEVPVSGAATAVLRVPGLTNGTEYHFWIVAVNAVGDGPESNHVFATPLGPVGTPVPTATPGDTTVALSWPEPASGGHQGPLRYYVSYKPSGSATWTLASGGQAGRTATLTGLTNGVKYDFGVVATAVDGESSSMGTTSATPLGPLGTPVPTAVSGGTATEAVVSWPVPSSGGRTLSGYQVVYRPVGATAWTTFGTVSSPTATITGLTDGPAYEFGVTALATDGATSAMGTTSLTLAVNARAKAISGASKLKVSVYSPCTSQFRFRVQKRKVTTNSHGSDEPTTVVTWKYASKKTYRTTGSGTPRTRTLNFGKGTYRAVVSARCGFAGTTTNAATLKK